MEIDLPNMIKVLIDKLYVRHYIGDELIHTSEKNNNLIYREEIVNNFKKEIKNYSKFNSENNFEDNKKLLEQLRNIQIAVTQSKIFEFKFGEFVTNSLNLKLGSIYFILKHIDSTLMFLYGSQTSLKSILLNDYNQISIIYKLLKNIMKYGSNIGHYKKKKKVI